MTSSLPMPVPVSCPPRVADLLRGSPDGPVRLLHAGPVAAYVEIGDRVIGVVGPRAVALPITMRYGRNSWSPLTVGRLYLEAGVLHAGVHAFVTGRIVDVRAPRIGLDGYSRSTASPAAREGAPPPLAAGLVQLPQVIDPATLPTLIGRGDGLTPLGDDVVCGWLALHRAAGIATDDVDEVVLRLLPRTTAVSAALLESALLGEVADPVGDHLRALGTPAAAQTRSRLLAVGHTSGAGLVHGIDLALDAALNERSAA